MGKVILDVRDLNVSFYKKKQEGKAVRGATFTVEEGQTLGIIGDSGSGKSVSGMSVMGLIPSTGGVIKSGEILYEKNISQEALRQLLELSRELEIPLEVSVDSVLYLTEQSLQMQQGIAQLDFHLNTILVNHGKIVPSLEPYCKMAVEKVNLPYIPPQLHRKAEEMLRDIPVSAVWSSGTSMEITHPDAQKGIALEALCNLLNIPPENTLALGDSGNDESMLKKAGIGVAMGNAPDFIKAAADAVTETNDHDGAAIAIERYALTI